MHLITESESGFTMNPSPYLIIENLLCILL